MRRARARCCANVNTRVRAQRAHRAEAGSHTRADRVMTVLQSIASVAVPAAAGLGGVWLGVWLNARNERRRRQFDFMEKQLRELYSPLLSIRKHVRALSELRPQVATVAGNVWQELCREARERGGAQALQELTLERSPAFNAIIQYENEQWKNELLPSYEQMLKIFRDNFWLAEISTRDQFGHLIVYIELWNRALNRTIPGEVIAQLGIREAVLNPLYEDIERTFAELRRKLSLGAV